MTTEAEALGAASRWAARYALLPGTFARLVTSVTVAQERYARAVHHVERRAIAVRALPAYQSKARDVRPFSVPRDPWSVDPNTIETESRCVTTCPSCDGDKRVRCGTCAGRKRFGAGTARGVVIGGSTRTSRRWNPRRTRSEDWTWSWLPTKNCSSGRWRLCEGPSPRVDEEDSGAEEGGGSRPEGGALVRWKRRGWLIRSSTS